MAILGTRTGAPLLLGGHLVSSLVAVASAGPTSIMLVDYQMATVNRQPVAQPVVQRKAGHDYADVPVMVLFTGGQPTAGIQVQIRTGVGGAVLLPWASLAGLILTAPMQLQGTVRLPIGTNYAVEVRDAATQPTSGPLFSASSIPLGVGIVIPLMGQSDLVQTFSGNYASIVPGTSQGEDDWYYANRPGAVFSYNGWSGIGNNDANHGPGSTSNLYSVGGNTAMFLRLVAAGLKAKYGSAVPVAVIPMGFNGNSIDNFVPGSTHYNELFNGSGTMLGSFGFKSGANVISGDFEMVLWEQGGADAASSVANYVTRQQVLVQGFLDWVAQFGRTPAQFTFATALQGNFSGLYSIENIRHAQQQFVTQARAGTLPGQAAPWPGVQFASNTVDLWRGVNPGVNPPTDPLHFSAVPIQTRNLRRFVQTVLTATGCASVSGAGPTLPGTYTRSANVVTFDVVVPSGTALTTSGSYTTGAPTGWYANTAADFSGTSIPVTVALPGGAKVAVTVPAGTATPFYIGHCCGKVGDTVQDVNGFTASSYPDIRNIICDSFSYPSGAVGTDVEAFGLPLQPSFGAITIN